MFAHIADIAEGLGAAWLAGSLVGMERTYNGRAAGFRTHALVALAAASAVTLALQPSVLPGVFASGPDRLDPSRLAQGVMTGVGFIGAGVIFKEGVSVQGLTTAACLWATAAIGLLCGAGLYAAAALSTGAVLTTLIGFRWLEAVAPGHVYAMAAFRFRADATPSEPELRALLGEHDVTLSDLSYQLKDGGGTFEYRGNLKTRQKAGFKSLSARLTGV
jgi:putative Mg2+ transporter-C (MgtC) family protein